MPTGRYRFRRSFGQVQPINFRGARPDKYLTGLLDTYGGASAAYSLRALSSSFQNSDLILARRSSDNAELGFTATEISDGTLTTWAGVGNAFVKTWYDQSGNALDVTQAATANQPQIVSSGSLITLGGKPSLSFDATKELVSTASFASSQPVSVFHVNRYNAANMRIWVSSLNSSRAFVGASLEVGIVSGVSLISAASAVALSTDYVRFDLINSTSSQVFINGSSAISGNAGSLDFGGTFSIGAGAARYNGHLPELIVYASNKTADKAGIEANQAEYYGITLS